jgi:hypothetical protein
MIDVGGIRDTIASLDALVRTDGWQRVTDDVSLMIDRAMQRMVQADCPDRERAELAGEIRALQRVNTYPHDEVSRLLAQVERQEGR